MVEKVKGLVRVLTQPRCLFAYALVIFVLLLFRNPFSIRTLIPNLEPYPDTIHYLTPARSFAQGGPFRIVREGRTANQGVPPLYSLIVIPFYLINSDVRMFYFANVVLSLLSLYLFFLLLKKVTSNKWIVGITLLLFVTNFFVYWYPEWAMAENLLLPIFLWGLLLLVLEVSPKNIVLAAFVSIAFYGIKYASAPVTLVYWFLYLIKIINEKGKKILAFNIGIYLSMSLVFLATLIWFASSIGGPNPIQVFVGLINSYIGEARNTMSPAVQATSRWVSLGYFKVNGYQYLRALIGKSARFLWDFTPIIPSWIGSIGILGIISTIFTPRKTGFLFFSMVALLGAEICFMSTFYAFDLRYIYFAIPILLLGFGFFLERLRIVLTKWKLYPIFVLIVFFALGYYLFGNAIRVKNQIVLNLKYAETPWYYISVLKLNSYFSESTTNKPYVITPMVPYYVDFYSNGNYRLLPLFSGQEFRNNMKAAWGNYDYSDLNALYKRLIKSGNVLYVSTYGLGNESSLHQAFDNLYKDFELIEVQNECYTQCRIYRLELKNAKGS